MVGPTLPYKGGVAAHTTDLAHHLADAGHDTSLVAWRHLYPSLLYPGELSSPRGTPDVRPFAATTRPLSWARPDSWWRTGRRLRHMDLIIVVHVVPISVPAHLTLIRAARTGRTPPTVVALTHNVLPHESRIGDAWLMRRLMSSVDAVVVHGQAEADRAVTLGAGEVHTAALPPSLPGRSPCGVRESGNGPVRLLALGIVREYKGLDLVLNALREVPDVSLTIAGEFWGAAGEAVKALATEPELVDRVSIRDGYVPADDIAELLAAHDVMVLAYRSATGSQNAVLAHHHRMPVLATSVGSLSEHIRNRVDGLVIPPEDHDALVAALRTISRRDDVEAMRANITAPDLVAPWTGYLEVLDTIARQGPRHRQRRQTTS